MGLHRQKYTKSEITKPDDRHHFRGAHRGRKEEQRTCSEAVRLAEEESWMKTKPGEGDKCTAREMQKAPERIPTQVPP